MRLARFVLKYYDPLLLLLGLVFCVPRWLQSHRVLLVLDAAQGLTITDPNEAWHFHILPDGGCHLLSALLPCLGLNCGPQCEFTSLRFGGCLVCRYGPVGCLGRGSVRPPSRSRQLPAVPCVAALASIVASKRFSHAPCPVALISSDLMRLHCGSSSHPPPTSGFWSDSCALSVCSIPDDHVSHCVNYFVIRQLDLSKVRLVAACGVQANNLVDWT